MRLHRLALVYTCQNATMLEITCRGSYIFIQLVYNKNDHLAKQSISVRFLMSSLPSTALSPVYRDMSLPKEHLGPRVGEHLKTN